MLEIMFGFTTFISITLISLYVYDKYRQYGKLPFDKRLL